MKRNRSVLFGWACSYVSVLLIPVIFIYLNYVSNVHIIKEEAYQVNEIVLENLKNGIDELLDKEISYYNYIISSPGLQKVMSGEEKNAQWYYDLGEFVRDINSYANYQNCNLIGMIYFQEKNLVIREICSYTKSDYYKSREYAEGSVVPFDEWDKALTAAYQNEFLEDTAITLVSQNYLLFANRYSDYKGNEANIFIGVPGAEIKKKVGLLSEGRRLIIAIDGRPVFEVTDETFGLVSGQNMILPTGEENRCETDEYIAVHRGSTKRKIDYYLLTNTDEFDREARKARDSLLLSLFAVSMIGAGSISVFLKYHFKPVAELVERIGEGGKRNTNEYELIRRTYERVMNENESMQQTIAGQERKLLSSYLLSLLKGRKSEHPDLRDMVASGSEIVLCGFSSSTLDEKWSQDDELMLFMIDNIFREMMADDRCFYIEEGKNIFYLFTVEETECAEWREQCLKKMDEVCSFLYEKAGYEVMAAVSDCVSSLEKSNQQYKDLLNVFNDREKWGGVGAIDVLQFTSSESPGKKAIVPSVKEYIEEHYAEVDLSVSVIAEGIGWNVKYMSRVFRNEMGRGILDYMHHFRIVKALELMRTNQYPLGKVREMVGYSDAKTFRRAFMKVAGVTPKAYLEEQEKGDKK